ncbi:hypothetical protein LXD69_03905 [Flavobacterium sediminilitoris]|uniref:Outer membrane protein beta-barrel domain-containing protein n=1 Tax=Flavobacterium sediminilitoris TaxID=2024526 RepID=A0ABY4HPX5_9FLAO|nr:MULTISPECIES: BT1926 family outer membrane beta-barrel protein [Flavobacterium]UOX34655.1 hypothetical protein LXD69_03905 [Flavobacterium sediminilitoris]
MKKIVLCAFALTVFNFINAQEESTSYKPLEGTVTTEVGLTGGLNNANFNLGGGLLKFRYFLKEDIGLRLGVSIDNDKTEDITGTSPNQTTFTDKNSDLNFKLGVEKHFAGSSRLSTYAGADLIIGSGKVVDDEEEENGDYDRFEQKRSNFGFAVFSGADYYIAEKLYLGVEAGISFLSSKLKDGERSVKNGNNLNTFVDPGSKSSGFDTNVFGGIRIGYQF